MKRFLAAAAATVLGSVSAFADPPPVFNWTGFYIGGHIGSGSEHATLSGLPAGAILTGPIIAVVSVPTPDVRLRSDGLIGGGQLGFNWQSPSNVVVGVEADFSRLNGMGSGSFTIPQAIFPSTTGTAQFQTDWFGTVRGRVGYAAGNLLFYGTGGFAWAKEKLSTSGSVFCLCIPFFVGFVPFGSSDSQVVHGWTAGGGADYAFAQNWFVRLEYLHVDFGTKVFAGDPTLVASLPVRSRVEIIRFGLNYKFGN